MALKEKVKQWYTKQNIERKRLSNMNSQKYSADASGK